MATKKIPIEKATVADLRQFAQESLGIEIHHSCSLVTALAKVREAGHDKPDITLQVPDEVEAPAAGSAPRPVTAAQKAVPAVGKIKIRIPQSEEPGGKDHVPVSVNGRAMVIPRDQDVEIPYPFYHALKNAVRIVYEQKPEGGISDGRPVPQYAFNTLSSESEIKAAADHWLKIETDRQASERAAA